MRVEPIENPNLYWYDSRFDCHRQQLQKNLAEFETHLSATISAEKPARVYCWDRKRDLYKARARLMERWTTYARLIVKSHRCYGSKDIWMFYKLKKEKWVKKYKEWFKEYTQYIALNENYIKLKAKFDKDLKALEDKAAEDTDAEHLKFPCKEKVKEVADQVKAVDDKEVELETLRGEVQDIRFEVETLTHRLKHYKTLCTVSEDKSRRFKVLTGTSKEKKLSFLEKMQTSKNLKKQELQASIDILKKSGVSVNQLNLKNDQGQKPQIVARLKKTRSEMSDESVEEEDNEVRLCGQNCKTMPPNYSAKFIHAMFDDYLRMQTTVALTWSTMNKYNKRAYKGRLECEDVERELAKVETEINEVDSRIGTITGKIATCQAEQYETKTRREMWLYWVYKIENFVQRERVMLFRKKYYSRNHLRVTLIYLGETSSSYPETSKPECDNWDITKGIIEARVNVMDEYKSNEETQKTEFTASKEALTTEVAEAYPCQQPLECTVVGETYFGDRTREICNMIEEDDIELQSDEDCRMEKVLDPTAPPQTGTEPAKTINYAILMNRGFKYFCSVDSQINPPTYEAKPEEEGEVSDPNTPEPGKEFPTGLPFFDMFAKRKQYRDELTEAENEIISFDVTRHERCLSCGTLGIDKFVCKSKLKIWTGDITKRERNGLAYLKTLDERGDFIENSNVNCEVANYMQSVQDEKQFLVRTKDIAFYLCRTVSSDDTKAKFDFTDPDHCERCEKFDPENDLTLAGDENDVDTEESITPEQDEDEEDSKKESGKGKDQPKDKESAKETEESKKMSHAMKLAVIKDKFKDWLEFCDVKPKPLENAEAVELDGTSYTPYYSGDEAKVQRWAESRCELDYSAVNEQISVTDCLYSPSSEDPEKYVLYFKLVKRARDNKGKKSTSGQTEYYTMTVCDKPNGHTETSDEDYAAGKELAKSKKHHGVIDGKEADNEAYFMNPILYFKMGNECMKVCDYATYINLLEMHFTKEELLNEGATGAEGTQPEARYKNKKLVWNKFLKDQKIKQRLKLVSLGSKNKNKNINKNKGKE